MTYDLVAHLHRQREFSERTFGPGCRTKGVVKHIRKELTEIEKDPYDVMEWVDVILLALDGAWRHGHSSEAIAIALQVKQTINEKREWPDWRKTPPDRAIEHIREEQTEDKLNPELGPQHREFWIRKAATITTPQPASPSTDQRAEGTTHEDPNEG